MVGLQSFQFKENKLNYPLVYFSSFSCFFVRENVEYVITLCCSILRFLNFKPDILFGLRNVDPVDPASWPLFIDIYFIMHIESNSMTFQSIFLLVVTTKFIKTLLSVKHNLSCPYSYWLRSNWSLKIFHWVTPIDHHLKKTHTKKGERGKERKKKKRVSKTY